MKKSAYKALDKTGKILRELKLDELFCLEALRKEWETAQEEFDQKSETWQVSEKGEEEFDRLNYLESLINELDYIVDARKQAIEHLTEIEGNAPEGSFS